MARLKSQKDKMLADDERLMRMWRKWHREQLEEALTGPHAEVMGQLMVRLKDLHSARELVTFIETQDWSAIDADTRLIALHQINTAITKLRELAELEPIDDALWHEPPRAFQLIKKIITSFPPSVGRPSPTTGNQ
jgi:hypothetical protein